MSEENFKKIEEEMTAFATVFEEKSMTLIAKMAEINDKLNRVSGAVEMVDKLRIQNAENKRVMTSVSTGLKNLTRRLEKMSRDGFVIPDSPTPEQAKKASANALNATVEIKEEQIDDLADLGEPPTMEELQNQLNNMGKETPSKTIEPEPMKQPITPEPEEKVITPTIEPPKTAQIQPVAPQPDPITTIQPNDDKIITPAPAPNNDANKIDSQIQYVQSASGIPKSQLERINDPKTPADILNNLIVDVEEANLESHVGGLILKAKDALSAKVPFHTTYFEMIMEGGKVKASNKPNSPELVSKTTQKIKEWMSKF